MLLGAIEHVILRDSDERKLFLFGRIYGQEKNLKTAVIAWMKPLLHGIEDFKIAHERACSNSECQ